MRVDETYFSVKSLRAVKRFRSSFVSGLSYSSFFSRRRETRRQASTYPMHSKAFAHVLSHGRSSSRAYLNTKRCPPHVASEDFSSFPTGVSPRAMPLDINSSSFPLLAAAATGFLHATGNLAVACAATCLRIRKFSLLSHPVPSPQVSWPPPHRATRGSPREASRESGVGQNVRDDGIVEKALEENARLNIALALSFASASFHTTRSAGGHAGGARSLPRARARVVVSSEELSVTIF